MISRFNDFAPPTLLAQAAADQLLDPPVQPDRHQCPRASDPLYVLGRELLDIFPVAFLPENHTLAIAIMSYNGKIDFGLLGDYDAMEDVALIGEGSKRRSNSSSRRRSPPPRPGSGAPKQDGPPQARCRSSRQ